MYNRGADNRRPSPSVKGEWRKKKKKSNCNILDFGEKRRKKKKKKRMIVTLPLNTSRVVQLPYI